jgi:thymidylate kinase
MLIVIIGPDGCGKTSVANAIEGSYAEMGFRSSKHYATHFQILPTFSQLKIKIFSFIGKSYVSKNGHAEGEYLAGMAMPINSVNKSLILLAWYAVDYFLGRSRIVKAKREGGVIVFARYYYDFYYQRVNSKLPSIIVKLFEKIIPKPDVIFFLKRDPDLIFKLKPELSIDEILRQNAIIEKTLSSKVGFVQIDANNDLVKVITDVKNIIRAAV